jgi:hypothetical protein
MNTEILGSTYAAELLARQEALQSEAKSVLEDLHLIATLSPLGKPQQIGSSVTGLMVWRDIDCNVVSPRLSIPDAFEVVGQIATHPRVGKVRYLNETGKLNPTGEPRDERYFFILAYAPDRGEEWKIDISFWLNDLPRSEMEDLENLRKQLTAESRLAILWIKDVWHRLPTYRVQVCSMDIYDAVLKHNVKTPSGFDRYLAERGKPTRQS